MREKLSVCYIGYLSIRASSSVTTKELPNISKPPRPPHYRSTHPYIPLGTKLDEFPNAGDADGSGPRLYEYWKMGETVRGLPTSSEKIAFVNPYERQWTKFEKTWRREHHPELMTPRRAWNIPAIPKYFDSMNFYKYITKTRVVEGMDNCYGDLNPPTKTFEKKLIEALAVNSSLEKERKEKVHFILRNIVDAALIAMSHNVHHLQDCSVAYSPRCESFWVRSGFLSMYDRDEDLKDTTQLKGKRRFPCDDIRRLGELVFVLRDEVSVQVRSKQPLIPIFTFANETELYREVFDKKIKVSEDVIFSPKIFNMWPDSQPLWQCPGYEPDCGDPNKFGRVAFKDVSQLSDFCEWWKVYGEEKEEVVKECLTAASVVSLFSWLNGQAHALGYTQYNDIENPLVSQLVLSDGQNFFFALAQLNTIAINIQVKGFVNDRSNVCYVEGPFLLYDGFDVKKNKIFHLENERQVDGLNPHVLKRLLQMFIRV